MFVHAIPLKRFVALVCSLSGSPNSRHALSHPLQLSAMTID
jgi:hypothetical protein